MTRPIAAPLPATPSAWLLRSRASNAQARRLMAEVRGIRRQARALRLGAR